MDICRCCKSENLIMKATAPHVGLYCGDCGEWQKWIKQENPDSGENASEKQQKYALSLLRLWKNKDVPMTKNQAGAIIKAFKEV